MFVRMRRVAQTAVLLLALPLAAPADQRLATSLGDILGQERAALGAVPQDSLDALVSGPALEGDDLAAKIAGAEAAGDAQWQCLTEALYFEARGETDRGILAVAEVILNRAQSGLYPSTVCGVVHQGGRGLYACQFTYHCDGHPDVMRDAAARDRVGRIAQLALAGELPDVTGGATHYHTRAVSPSWARRFEQTASIGAHLFYRQPMQIAMN